MINRSFCKCRHFLAGKPPARKRVPQSLLLAQHHVDDGVDVGDVDFSVQVHVSSDIVAPLAQGLAQHHVDCGVDVAAIDRSVAVDLAVSDGNDIFVIKHIVVSLNIV